MSRAGRRLPCKAPAVKNADVNTARDIGREAKLATSAERLKIEKVNNRAGLPVLSAR
jgi:hypothetical protein